MKRQILLAILIGLTMLTGFSQPVSNYGSLQVNGTQLCDSAGKPVILRGMSFGWFNWWPRFYNADAVAWLTSDWKVDAVRAAMGVEPAGAYLTDSATQINHVKTVVEAAIDQGIYVIIDWHSHGLQLDAAKKFFAYMAETYGNYPNVLYEIYNEPDDNYTWEQVKAYSLEVLQIIRAIDEDNIILVGSPHWDQDLDQVAANPITGYSNLMYTMHFYAGTHGSWLRDRCDAAMESGIPIFVSECASCNADGNGAIDYASWNAFEQWMEQKRISWFTWSISDKDETSAVLNASAASTGGWQTADLKEWGQMVRGLFNKYEYSYEPARIYKAMDKGRRGEDLKIGVIGGSITQGFFASTEQKRWANLMDDWWKGTFPNSKVTLINAGWGGTGSDIGVHRVYDDLLVQNPDFIVIEFAVNDAEGELATKMMEGLVQQIILNENAPGIMVLALKQENGTTAQASHKKVTDYYHIPLVSFADSIDAQVAADGLTLHDIYEDGIHPNDIGMQYMADFIIEQLDTLYANLPAANALPPVNTNLPAPLVTDTYAHTFQFFPDNIIPISNHGWDIADNGWSTSTPGNQIDFQVMGNAFSLVFTQNIGSERGRAEVWVDEGQKTVIDAFMNEDWGTRYAFSLIQEGLDDGEHILHIRCMNETSTSGNFVQVTRILVAGNIGSAAPIALTSGYQKGVVGNELLLDGTQSYDPDGEAIDAFSWTITEKPANSTTAIGNAASSIATFTPDIAGTYKISLVVSSGINASVPFIKTLDVRATNSIPVAVAGNDTLSALGKYFRFDGSKSFDADGDALTYQWFMESAPETSAAELMGVTNVKPQIKFDVEGDYTFSLVVFDSIDYSEKSYIKVTAKEGYTKIQEKTEIQGNIMIYPNPTRDKITIDFTRIHASIMEVAVFSIIGTSVFRVVPSTEENIDSRMSINLNEKMAKKGIYLIMISTAEKQYVQRITLL